MVYLNMYMCLVIVGLLAATSSLKIPRSFSLESKEFDVDSTSQIQTAIKNYEFDSHLNILLLGNFDKSISLEKIGRMLDRLSLISAMGSPYESIHEKVIYHISFSSQLTAEVAVLLKNHALDQNLVEKVLSNHHKNSAASTSLFLLYFPSLTVNDRIYKTHSVYNEKICTRNAFVSHEDYAWIDMNAAISDILPAVRGRDILTWRNLTDIVVSNTQELASFIHRSAEALFPSYDQRRPENLPYLHSNFLPRKQFTVTKYQIILLTVCVDSRSIDDEPCSCTSDVASIQTLRKLSRTYSNMLSLISFTEEFLCVSDNPQLMNALAGSMSTIQNEPRDKIISIDSAQFLFWLKASTTLKNLLAAQQYGILQLPVVVIKIPNVHIVIDNQFTVVANDFIPPAGGWNAKNPESEVMANTLSWPESIIMAVNSLGDSGDALRDEEFKQEISYDEFMRYSQHLDAFGLKCNDQTLKFDAVSDFKNKLWNSLRQTIWDIEPTTTYYSPTAGKNVQDYLWGSTEIFRTLAENEDLSFRERRSVLRFIIFSRAENLLEQLATIIRYADGMIPRLDVMHLLGPVNHRATGKNMPDGRWTKGGYSDKKVQQVSEGLLSELLSSLHSASDDFSHLDFHGAIMKIMNAESTLLSIERAVTHAAAARVGFITCEPDFDDTNREWVWNNEEKSEINNLNENSETTVETYFVVPSFIYVAMVVAAGIFVGIKYDNQKLDRYRGGVQRWTATSALNRIVSFFIFKKEETLVY